MRDVPYHVGPARIFATAGARLRHARWTCMALSSSHLFGVSIAMLLIAGCTAELEPDGATDEPTALLEPGERATSLSAIEGFWLVERFEDFEPSWENDTPWRRAYVQIGSEGLSYSVGCNRSFNPAEIDSGGVLRDTGDGSRMQTLMGCGAQREERDGRFFAFFGSNPEVRWLGKHRLHMESAAGTLVLIQPEAWRLANVPELDGITGRWIPRMSLRYDGWGHEGFGIGDKPGVITIAPNRLSWSRCPDSPVRVSWTDAGRFENRGGDPAPCATGSSDNSSGEREVMDMLASDPAIIRTGPHHIVMIDGNGQKGRELQLQTEESVLNPPPLPPPPESDSSPPPPPPPPPIPRG